LALVRLELQPVGDLRVALRELRPDPADVCELALVVVQQLVTHCESLPSTRRQRPRSRIAHSRSATPCRTRPVPASGPSAGYLRRGSAARGGAARLPSPA